MFQSSENTFYDRKKNNEHSGVQKDPNWNNSGIPRNSERISQPSTTMTTDIFQIMISSVTDSILT